MLDIESRMNQVFNENIRGLLVSSLRKAYDSVCESHDEDKGFDSMTFGISIYRLGKFEISKHIKDIKDNDIHIKDSFSFRFTIGGYEVACHKVGHNSSQDIKRCFPNNTGAAHELVSENLEMINHSTGESIFTEPDLSNAKKLVLAHLGNPEDGCTAIYLCVPISSHAKQINEWGHTMLLWKSEVIAESKEEKSQQELPASEEQVPLIPLRKKKKTSTIDLQ